MFTFERVTPAEARRGDVFFTHHHGWTDRLIRIFTTSPVSHCGLIVSVVEGTEGVSWRTHEALADGLKARTRAPSADIVTVLRPPSYVVEPGIAESTRSLDAPYWFAALWRLGLWRLKQFSRLTRALALAISVYLASAVGHDHHLWTGEVAEDLVLGIPGFIGLILWGWALLLPLPRLHPASLKRFCSDAITRYLRAGGQLSGGDPSWDYDPGTLREAMLDALSA